MWQPEAYRRELIELLGVDDKPWDMLLAGDGSGSRWGLGTGWGCISIMADRAIPANVWHGAANNGTVQTSEMMAYVMPLAWYYNMFAENSARQHNVYILTDSRYTVELISNPRQPRAHAPLWYFYRGFSALGITLHPVHARRDTSECNRICDAASKHARRVMETYDKLEVT